MQSVIFLPWHIRPRGAAGSLPGGAGAAPWQGAHGVSLPAEHLDVPATRSTSRRQPQPSCVNMQHLRHKVRQVLKPSWVQTPKRKQARG